jgi:hypothetical protein
VGFRRRVDVGHCSNGLDGGVLFNVAKNVDSRWNTPTSLDTPRASQGWARWYLVPHGSAQPLALRKARMIGSWQQTGGKTGCYLMLERRGDGRYMLHPCYHGLETISDLNFGTFALPTDWPESGAALPVDVNDPVHYEAVGDCVVRQK